MIRHTCERKREQKTRAKNVDFHHRRKDCAGDRTDPIGEDYTLIRTHSTYQAPALRAPEETVREPMSQFVLSQGFDLLPDVLWVFVPGVELLADLVALYIRSSVEPRGDLIEPHVGIV